MKKDALVDSLNDVPMVGQIGGVASVFGSVSGLACALAIPVAYHFNQAVAAGFAMAAVASVAVALGGAVFMALHPPRGQSAGL